MHVLTYAVVAVLALAFYDAVDAQAYSYNVTVILANTKKFDSHDGKLKINLKGTNFKYLIAMSPKEEELRSGSIYSYLVAAPHDINQITGASLEWSRKKKVTDPSTWFSTPKIYVDQVIIDPVYIQHSGMRLSATKKFCGKKGAESVAVKKEVDLKYKC